MQLAGRVAVVTGAAGGIGKAICDRFGHEGMKVVAADLDAVALDAAVEDLRAKSLDVTGVPVDVTKRESVESLRDAAVDAYGAVHVLCNNAGIANTAFGNVWEHENNDWRWSLEVHLFGVINGCATFVPWLLDHGDEGWIVNTVSGNGGVVPLPDSAPYALAKASKAEVQQMGADIAEGHITSAPYFQSVAEPVNLRCVDNYKRRFGDEQVTNQCWEAAYFQMHMLADAMRRMGSDSVSDLLRVLPGSSYAAPQGTIRIDEHNHHTYLHPRIGRVNAAGQFDIVEQVERTVRPDPYLVSHSLQDWSARSRLTDQA